MIRTFELVVLVAALGLVSACGNDVEKKGGGVSVNGSTNATAGDGGTNGVIGPDAGGNSDASVETTPDATMSSEDAPVIVELSAAPTSLSEGDLTTISAVVTDAQGPQDIVAGRLLDGQTQTLIGNFTSLAGGSFEIEVTWAELDGVRPINFGAGGTTRAVTAEFIDNANERSTRSLSLMLTCQGLPACGGSCGAEDCDGVCSSPQDYTTVDNCGSCGNSCASGDDCVGGMCEEVMSGIGDPCIGVEDCPETAVGLGLCATEAQFGAPGGYCTAICVDGMCPADSVCLQVEVDGTPTPVCALTCAGSGDCRAGYSCTSQPVMSGGFDDVCSPF